MLDSEFETSSGIIVSVKELGIFDLDHIQKPDTKPFTYIIEFGPIQVEEEYNLHLWKRPPNRPNKPFKDCVKDSKEWYDWREYHLFWSAVKRRKEISHNIAQYLNKVKDYIFNNCISKEDQQHIKTIDDWDNLCLKALVPQLSLNDLEKIANESFQAKYGNESVLTAFLNLNGGDTNKVSVFYNFIRDWEVKTITANGMSESEWAKLSIEERGRKIFSNFIDDWVQALYYHRDKNDKT